MCCAFPFSASTTILPGFILFLSPLHSYRSVRLQPNTSNRDDFSHSRLDISLWRRDMLTPALDLLLVCTAASADFADSIQVMKKTQPWCKRVANHTESTLVWQLTCSHGNGVYEHPCMLSTLLFMSFRGLWPNEKSRPAGNKGDVLGSHLYAPKNIPLVNQHRGKPPPRTDCSPSIRTTLPQKTTL